MLSAALAGISARLICHPLDTIKTVSFTDFAGDHHLRSATGSATAAHAPRSRIAFLDAAQSIMRREGLKGMYRGVGVACVGSVPGVALYLTTYEKVSHWWLSLGRATDSVTGCPSFLNRVAAATPRTITSFTSGLIAEAVSCVVWVPIDVSKERLQSQPPGLQGRYSSSLDALRTIARREGVGGLYKGYWSTLGSFGPFSAVYFACYECFSRHLYSSVFTEGSPRDGFVTALLAGAGGNTVASLVTNPLELIKTRLQVQRPVLDTEVSALRSLFMYDYSGLLDGIRTVAREDGVRALWKGVGCRIAYTAPNAALTMAFYHLFRGASME